MSTALNDRDAILQAASVRIINPKNASILLNASPSLFHLNAAGAVDVATITITATLVGLEGDVTFTADGAALTGVTGKSAVVRYADMQGPAAIVTARIVAGGEPFTQSCIIGVVRDGAPGNGTPGARGAGQYFAGGSAWSDGTANAATPGDNVVSDVVTISNGGTFAMTKRWDGAAWNAIGAVFDGSLFVTGSINGAAIRAGTLDIRAPDGSIVLKATASLAEQTKSSPNLAARLSSWTPRGAAGYVTGSQDDRFINGEYAVLNPGSGYVAMESNALNIPRNSWYTFSFDAYCTGVPVDINADVYGYGADSAGLYVTLTNTIKRYKFTDLSADFPDMPKTYLRVFRGGDPNSGSAVVISNVKVEMGVTATAWSDNVITPGNAASYVMPNAINNTMIGGDIFSSNWNGIVGPGGAGWLLQRSGALYAGAVQLRGSISGGSYTSYATPSDPAQIGFYVGPEGFKLGNSNSGKYITGTADGNMYMPGFKHEGGQLTLDRPVILNPAFNTKSASISSSGGTYFTAARNNPNAYMGSHAMNVSGMTPVRYVWSLDYSAPPSTFAPRLTNWSQSTSISAAVSALVGQSFDAYLTCTAFDAGGLSVSAWTTITLEIV
jgi:hypothetical protein